MTAPINHDSLVAQVESHIRRQILMGSLRSGTQLQQQQVAQELGISPTPVREAFAALAAHGLVTIERNRGAFVQPITADGMSEYCELAIAVFGYVTERAVERRTPDDIEHLQHLAAEISSNDDPHRVWQLMRAFNLAVLDIAKAPRARTVLRNVGALLPDIFESFPELTPVTKISAVTVADALAAGDAVAASRIYRSYLENNYRAIISRLRARNVLA